MEFLPSDLRVVFIGTLDHPKNLCCIEASINPSEKRHSSAKSLHHSRILKCRQLIFSVPQIIASPVLETDFRIYIIMQRQYFDNGEIPRTLEKMKIVGRDPVVVSHDIFEQCLQYTLATKVAPLWNQVKGYFVCGRSFLTATEALPAVKVDICVKDSETFMIVWPMRILLEQTKLEDFGVSSKLKHEFSAGSLSTITENHIGTQYANVLPTFARGQILQISRHIPESCPYTSYKELKRHWKNMYGYRLPEEEGEIYYTIAFVNSSTNEVIPSPCVRSHDIILLNQMNPSHILEWFYDILLKKMPMICGKNMFNNKKLAYVFSKEEEEFNSDLLSGIFQVSNLKVTDVIEREPAIFALSSDTFLDQDKNVYKSDMNISNVNGLDSPQKASEISEPLNILNDNNLMHPGSENMENLPEPTSNHKSLVNSQANKACLVIPRKPLQDISQVLNLNNIENWPGAMNRTDIDAKSVSLSTKKSTYPENCDNDARFVQTTLSRIALSAQKVEAVVSSTGSQGMQGFYTFPAQNLLMEQTRISSQTCLTFKDMLSSGSQQVNIISSNGQGIMPEKDINLKRDSSMLGPNNILGIVKKKPRSRPQVQLDVDVELVARNNDLQRVNKITLVYWLRNKLVPCKVKDKKSDLVIKVMEYLNLPLDKVQ